MTGNALKAVSASHHATIRKQILRQQKEEAHKVDQEIKIERIKRGTWHDGRLDDIAGNGIMSELGFGDERLWDEENSPDMQIGTTLTDSEKYEAEQIAKKQRSEEDMQAVDSLPIVLIRNFAVKGGSSRQALLDVFAQWAASLAENQVC